MRAYDLTSEGFLLPSELTHICQLLNLVDTTTTHTPTTPTTPTLDTYIADLCTTLPSADTPGTLCLKKLYEKLRIPGYTLYTANTIQTISHILYSIKYKDNNFDIQSLFISPSDPTPSTHVASAELLSKKLNVTDLCDILKRNVPFSDLSITECQALLTIIDLDRDGCTTPAEFITFFTIILDKIIQREHNINKYKLERRFRHMLKVAVSSKGLSALDLFAYFAKV